MRWIDSFIAGVIRLLAWLALPVTVLLFLQWPLREWIRVYSREANDLGQWLFALLVAASVVAATRARAHLATDAIARRYNSRTRARWMVFGIVFGLLPWALFVLWAGAPMIVASVKGLERFPDTGNFGYFILKAALAVLLGLIVLQAIVDLGRMGERR